MHRVSNWCVIVPLCLVPIASQAQIRPVLDGDILEQAPYEYPAHASLPARERGWTIRENHICTDAARSGASIQGRAGVQRLLAAAAQLLKPFDVLLVDDSSRAARDIPAAIRTMPTLNLLGIRVIYISQGLVSRTADAVSLSQEARACRRTALVLSHARTSR